MIDSAIMIANATQRIHPRAPSSVDDTGPGAQPAFFDKGESTAHPTSMPTFIETVTGKPMMMPWPIYDSDGVKYHIQWAARLVPNGALRMSNIGRAKRTGNRKERI